MTIQWTNVARLMRKDWVLNRKFATVTTLLSGAGTAYIWFMVVRSGNATAEFASNPSMKVQMGLFALPAMLVIYLVFLATLVMLPPRLIVREKDQKCLLFIRGLPISEEEYLLSKYAFGMTIYLFQVLSIFATVSGLRFLFRGDTQLTGMSLATIGIVLCFMMMILSVALLTYSGAWTVVAIGVFLVGMIGGPLYLRGIPAIGKFYYQVAGYGSAFYLVILGEAAMIVLIAWATRSIWLRRPAIS